MGTVATVEVIVDAPEDVVRPALRRALGWFATVEAAASRFDPTSELRRLVERVGQDVPVSPLLFEAIRFALALAELTDGAFDPTVGRALQDLGFDAHHATGQRHPAARLEPATFRDVSIDERGRTVRLRRRVALDLGAVAKGLAIDLAARELAPFGDLCVEAGGDLYAGGANAEGRPWRVGVQHPRDHARLADALLVADAAVCTSGDYERRTADGAGHHLVDPRTGRPVGALASVTVVAPSAMLADGLATAAFVLGPDAGPRLLAEQGVAGVFITPSGEVTSTGALRRAT
jgi:thiamine biosynthesis lipoprotein